VRLLAATYNAQSFRSGIDAAVTRFETDLPALPDLLLVQECGSARTARTFAASLDMDLVSSHRPLHRVRNAVLFRRPWRLVERELVEFASEGSTLRRGMVVAHLRGHGLRLTAVSAHLGLSQREREAHARELTDALAGIDHAVVVGVDLNEGPEGNAARWMADRIFDAFAHAGSGKGETFPATQPSARIDYLFTGGAVEARDCWVVPAAHPEPSDHLPVMAELELAEP
jgi:endonuclease/exonuclease/phosphatase family metal-dependent hydrolase